MASHAHLYAENIYRTEEHKNKELPGWIVGTAGAEQYQDKIQYGYLIVEVHSDDGTISAKFKEVGRDSPTGNQNPDGRKLIDYCFDSNKVPAPSANLQKCRC